MWRNFITSLYPDALQSTYTVPPEHFNKVPYRWDTAPGTHQPVLVQSHHPPSGTATLQLRHHGPHVRKQSNLQADGWSLFPLVPQPQAKPARVIASDYTDDLAQRHVLANLQALGDARPEPMFILSQVNFGNYLNKPAYAAAAAQLPQPRTLKTKDRRGDFDILLIHRHYGILVGELKSVGSEQPGLSKTPAEAEADVAKRVERAVEQLNKSERVVKHLVSDVASGLTVRKTLFLPYASSIQLQRALAARPALEEDFCQCLGTTSSADAVQLCVCSDQLSDPADYQHVTPTILSQLTTWWQRTVAHTEDPVLTDDLYMDIVARFVGPATTVSVHCNVPPRAEVRTKGEAVAELGGRLACLVLTPSQMALLQRSLPRVFLTGPPGTGKTVVLVLQGLRWLLQGHDVHVVSTRSATLASSVMIQHQLQMTLKADGKAHRDAGAVRLHRYDLYVSEADVDAAVRDLSAAVKEGHLHVIVDEASFENKRAGPRVRRLVKELADRVPELHLWAAGLTRSDEDVPPELLPQPLDTPLRSAPVIQREVAKGFRQFQVNDYGDSGIPAPGDGPNVVRLSHAGAGHEGRWPVSCPRCGQEAAAELRRLGVGAEGRHLDTSPAPLTYNDVFVLTRSCELQDDVTDDEGNVTSPASGFARGLRDAEFPVRVLGAKDLERDRKGWEKGVEQAALSRGNHVTVTYSAAVMGLERRVVVWLRGSRGDADKALSEELVDAGDRLFAVSRCTTQLLVVDVPPGTSGGQG